MDQAEVYDLWQADAGHDRQNKDRPAFVREHRDVIDEHIDTDDPLPGADDSLAAFAQWLDDYKGTVTRQLNPENGETSTTEHGSA